VNEDSDKLLKIKRDSMKKRIDKLKSIASGSKKNLLINDSSKAIIEDGAKDSVKNKSVVSSQEKNNTKVLVS